MNLYWSDFQHAPERVYPEWIFYRTELDGHKRLSAAETAAYNEEQEREKEFVEYSLHRNSKPG